MINAIKRLVTSIILSIALATLAGGPALADTPPTATFGWPLAEWIFNPSAISVTPAQGYVTIASTTFTTARSNLGWWGTFGWWSTSTIAQWIMDAEASAVFQAQSSSTANCFISIAIPGAVPSSGAGIQGIVTPNFSLGSYATATARIVGYQLYPNTAYTATASIAATGGGCNEIGTPLVKFTLKMRLAP